MRGILLILGVLAACKSSAIRTVDEYFLKEKQKAQSLIESGRPKEAQKTLRTLLTQETNSEKQQEIKSLLGRSLIKDAGAELEISVSKYIGTKSKFSRKMLNETPMMSSAQVTDNQEGIDLYESLKDRTTDERSLLAHAYFVKGFGAIKRNTTGNDGHFSEASMEKHLSLKRSEEVLESLTKARDEYAAAGITNMRDQVQTMITDLSSFEGDNIKTKLHGYLRKLPEK